MPARIDRHDRSMTPRRPRRANRRHRPGTEALETRDLLTAMMYQHFEIPQTPGLAGPLGPAPAASPLFFGDAYSPSDTRAYYGFDQITFTDAQGHQIPGDGRGQTIAIIDAYDDSTIAGDLHVFDQEFGLPDPPSFRKVNQTGGTKYPAADAGWATEVALDVEWAHAIAPAANILLVESTTNDDSAMFAAVDYARNQPNVVAVSMSWGSPEYDGESQVDAHLVTPRGHGGVTFLASTGDDGGQPESPATSPNVVSVGGTSLSGLEFNLPMEWGWSGSAGGVSDYNPQPSYQNGVVSQWSTTRRTAPDVSYNADPWNGFSIYDTTGGSGWGVVGGTSAGTPQWAALVAIADQGRALKGLGSLDGPSKTLPALYQMSPSDFHDITDGSNAQYQAQPGYDLVTGLGSPRAASVVNDLVLAGTYSGPFTMSATLVSATEETAFSGAVATIRDTYRGDTAASISATIDWGDGTRSPGTLVSNGRVGFDVDGTHTYALPGKYTVHITATRKAGGSASATGTATVADAPLTLDPFTSLFNLSLAFSGTVAWLSDGNTKARPGDFKATIDWGDGTTSPGQIVQPPGWGGSGDFEVNGTHVFAHAGTYQTRITVRDVPGGGTVTGTGWIDVTIPYWDGVMSATGRASGATFHAAAGPIDTAAGIFTPPITGESEAGSWAAADTRSRTRAPGAPPSRSATSSPDLPAPSWILDEALANWSGLRKRRHGWPFT
jgi:hypothetical protein